MSTRLKSILVIATAGLSSAACADVLVFLNDNPDFRMEAAGWLSVTHDYQSLDIKVDAWSQPAPQTNYTDEPDGSFSLYATEFYGAPETFEMRFYGKSSASVATGESVLLFDDNWGTERAFIPTLTIGAGVAIDDSMTWSLSSVMYMHTDSTDVEVYFVGEDPTFIVPVRIALGDGLHYGFVEFAYTASSHISDNTWQPIRWGYETDPDTALVIPSGCLADFSMDGVLDFFDVSAFLGAFASQDSIADLTSDGIFDFFDVSAFLGAFGAGCP